MAMSEDKSIVPITADATVEAIDVWRIPDANPTEYIVVTHFCDSGPPPIALRYNRALVEELALSMLAAIRSETITEADPDE